MPNSSEPDVSNESSPAPALTHDSGVDETTVQACVSRLKSWNTKGRMKTYWCLYEVHPSSESHADGEVLCCVLCHDLASPIPDAKDKRKREGYYTYKSGSGVNPIRRHFANVHKDLGAAVARAHGACSAAITRHKRRASEVQTTLPERLAKLPKYKDTSSTQKDFDRVMSLFVAETAQSLSIVDNTRFRQILSIANPRLKVPNRRQLTDTMIPSLVSDINDALVFPKIADAEGVTLSFDLWMSRGHQDVFDIYAHFLDQLFYPHHIHICMLRCENSNGNSLAHQLDAVIHKFKMHGKVVGCVSDGGSNMRTCINVLDESLPSHDLTASGPFKGFCFAHKLSLIFKHVLSSSATNGLTLISVDRVRAKLQSCLTWTKKSAKGAAEWASACERTGLPFKKIPTPVNTRWASAVNTLSLMLKYRRAVESYFQAQSERLQARLPAPCDWLVVSAIVGIMKPIMNALVISQTKSFFLLSDALTKLVLLHDSFTAQLAELPNIPDGTDDESEPSFESELISLKRSMLSKILSELYGVLDFMCSYDTGSAFMYAALALDPRFKGFGRFKRFVGGVDKLRDVSEQYDDNFLIPLIARCSGVQLHREQEAQVLLGDDDEQSGIFGEGDADDGPLDKVRWELSHFRKERYTLGRDTLPKDAKDALKWLKSQAQKYPAVSRAARLILGIVPTQVDNGRAFSVAGVVCSLRRSRLKVSTLSDLVHISLNTRKEEIFDDFEAADASACEELEEFGEAGVVSDELVAELREDTDPTGSDME